MTHDPIEDLLGAYALNAVDDDEREAIEAHLATCPRCRAEVDGHREVAAHLALGGAPAPNGLWERIAGAIDGEAAAPPLRLVVDDGSRRARTATPAKRWQRAGLALTAAAAAVAIVALSVSSVNQRDKVQEIEQAQGIESAALDAFGSPDARLANLVDDTGAVVVRAAILPDGTSYLFADNLPELDGRIYQLWGASGDRVVSLGPLGSAPDVLPFHTDETMTTIMITIEDEPVETSSNQPVAYGPIV